MRGGRAKFLPGGNKQRNMYYVGNGGTAVQNAVVVVVCLAMALGAMQFASAQGGPADRLQVKTTACRAAVTATGALLKALDPGVDEAVEIPLADGASVIALQVEATGPGAAVELWWASLQGLPDQAGPWLTGPAADDAALTQPEPPAGFVPASRKDGRFTVAPGKSCLRQVVVVTGDAPPWFPKMGQAFAVQGTRQLIKPYLPSLGPVSAYDCELTLALPAGVTVKTFDGGVGAQPTDLRLAKGSGGQVVSLSYDGPPGSAFGIFICWQDKNGGTIVYQPVVGVGGTHDWRRLRGEVQAPVDAVLARPIVLRWAHDKVIGEAWIDNITLAAADAPKRNLLAVGDFEDEQWDKQAGIEQSGPDGSRCLHVVLRQDDETHGWWVPRENGVEVQGGKTYVVEADVKADKVHVPGANPHAALLVACDRAVQPGAYKVTLVGGSRQAGARTVVRQTTLEVLPDLRDRRPKSVRLMPCYYSDVFRSREVIEAYAYNTYRSGITWTYGAANCELARLLLPKGHKVVCSLGQQPFVLGGEAAKYLKEHPELQAVKFDGSKLSNTACPVWFLGDEAEARTARAGFREQVLARLGSGDHAGFNWDIEQPVVEPPGFCICERCLANFRQFAGLGADVDLKPDELLKDPLRGKWVDFRCRQNADLVKVVSRWLKAAAPKVEFSVYSGYQYLFTKEHYGVDWALLAPYLDAGMSGYGFLPGPEAAAREALGGKPYLAGELYYLSPTSDEHSAPNPRHWANRVLRQIAFTGGHGIVIWWLPVYDGMVFYQTSLAAEAIAEHEDYFTKGRDVRGEFQATGLKQDEWFALQLGDRVLLLVLNFAPEPLQGRLESDTWRAPGEVSVEPYGRMVRVIEKAP